MKGYSARMRCAGMLAAAGMICGLLAGTAPARAADRVVLGEEFSNIW